LITLFICLTLAHPSVLLNDEFITTNQLRQLHDGHQVIINEGRYGLTENGSMSAYFAYRSNKLVYPLFLSLLSLPAYWMLDITGDHNAYLVLSLWTITSLLIILLINRFFPDFAYVANRKWTNVAFICLFAIFFLNLNFYAIFPVDPVNSYPEVLAIVFTNIILLAGAAVIIYEINRTIFEEPGYSFFATLVCLSSSSYFVWVTHCKDHILVLLIFSIILLCLVRFGKTNDYWYLPLSFLSAGLLAWIRPELALWMFLLLCGVFCYILIKFRSQPHSFQELLITIGSPLFTLLGAMPFFLNNLLVTKNILLPVMSVFLSEDSVTLAANSSPTLIRTAGVKSFQSLLFMFLPSIPANPVDFFIDLLGVFFYPQSGSVSVFALTPLIVVIVVVLVILVPLKKVVFTPEEKRFLCIALIVSIATFLTYVSQIHLLNVDRGIVPDIRYYSPMYLPFSIIGLIGIRKIVFLNENPRKIIKNFLLIIILGLPLSMMLVPMAYTFQMEKFSKGIFAIGNFFSLYVIMLLIISIVTILFYAYCQEGKSAAQYMILLLCSVPIFWQLNETIINYIFSGFSKYTFWIPIIRVMVESILNFFIFRG
jgi:hypothetical protein